MMTQRFHRTLFVKGFDATQPKFEVTLELWEMIYESEFVYLLELLVGQLLEPLSCSFEDSKNVAVIRTPDSTVARLSIHVKGWQRGQTYIRVQLGQEYKHLEAWFQLAFLGFKVRFRKPILHLRTSWMKGDSPRWP